MVNSTNNTYQIPTKGIILFAINRKIIYEEQLNHLQSNRLEQYTSHFVFVIEPLITLMKETSDSIPIHFVTHVIYYILCSFPIKFYVSNNLFPQ